MLTKEQAKVVYEGLNVIAISYVGSDVIAEVRAAVDRVAVDENQTEREKLDARVKEFFDEIDRLMTDCLKLSREGHADIFKTRDRLRHIYRNLIVDISWKADRDARHEICDRIMELFG